MIESAATVVHFAITRADVAAAHAGLCPATVALRRLGHLALVSHRSSHVDGRHYWNTPELRALVEAFDAGRPVTPGRYAVYAD